MTYERKCEKELKAIAKLSSKQIVIRDLENGVNDERRETTKEEAEKLYNIMYGALLALNWRDCNRMESDCVQAVLDTAEFTTIATLPKCNAYLTVYNPLRDILDLWGEEK